MYIDKKHLTPICALFLMIILYKSFKHHKQIDLYYQVRDGETSLREGFSYNIIDGETDDFAGNSIYLLRNKNYNVIEDSYISFNNCRVNPDNFPNSGIDTTTLKETFVVKDKDGDLLSATSLYDDTGSGSTTTINKATFAVNSGTGKYRYAYKAVIEFNSDGTRKVTVYF